MNWLTNYVRPRINKLIGEDKKNIKTENRWQKCPDCGHLAYQKDLELRFYVCKECSHHMRMPVQDRLAMLYDDGFYETIIVKTLSDDPLRFKDSIRYTERLKKARQNTKRQDAVLVTSGTIKGHACVVSVFDFAFMGGSLGSAAGEAFITAAQEACRTKSSLLSITSSGGARMQEGVLSLMQLPRCMIGVDQVRKAGLPYLVLLTNPTMGGVTASFAMVGDIHLAEPQAVIGFAGRRVVSTTSRVELPDDFQTAEFLKKKGFVDQVVPRKNQRHTIANTIAILRNNQAPSQAQK